MSSPRFRQVLPFLGFLLVCAVTVIGVDALFVTEEGDRSAEVSATEHGANYIEVNAQVINVDPVNAHLTLRLSFIPHGRFDNGEGLLAMPLEVDVSSIGAELIHFEAGRRMFPHEVIVEMYEGEVEAYPFDKHRALFEILVTGEDESSASIPTELKLFASHHGYKFTDEALAESSKNYLGYDLHMQRSPLVVGTVIFCMAIIWGLSIVNMFLFWLVIENKMEVDLGLFGYMSAFIVALYFFRQIFPNVPPFLGVFADYAAFFWAELITAGVSIGLAVKWFDRYLGPVGEVKATQPQRTLVAGTALAPTGED